jgi:type I restriction enzyme M protein
VFDRLASIETELAPYEYIKAQLTEARARYRELTEAFMDELKTCCTILSEDEKCALGLELFAQDVQAGADAAVAEKRQEVIRFVEGLWDKYRVPACMAMAAQLAAYDKFDAVLRELRYAT